MCCRARWILMVFALVSLTWARPAGAFTLIEDHFDLTISTAPSANPPISDVYFFRGYLDTNGAPTGELTNVSNLARGTGGIQIAALLPAVQSPPQEAYSLIGFCDGSVMVAMGDGSAANTIGNANFNFTTTFGVAESTVISDLQAGDQNAIIAVLKTAYTGGLLPAVQTGASPGTLVTFSTPANVGTIRVVENAAPEPATLCVMAPVLAMLVGRRRWSRARLHTLHTLHP